MADDESVKVLAAAFSRKTRETMVREFQAACRAFMGAGGTKEELFKALELEQRRQQRLEKKQQQQKRGKP
jgi:hypothetical protein